MRAQSSSLSAQQAAQTDFKEKDCRKNPTRTKIRVELNLSGGNRGEGRALASEVLFVAGVEA